MGHPYIVVTRSTSLSLSPDSRSCLFLSFSLTLYHVPVAVSPSVSLAVTLFVSVTLSRWPRESSELRNQSLGPQQTLKQEAVLAVSRLRSLAPLYRQLLRQCRLLPPDVQDYYKHYWRQQLNQHRDDEADGERMRAIADQALSDMRWLLQKYQKERQGTSDHSGSSSPAKGGSR